jgi:peptidoglycan/xylan/chitin deacetylase (PgdA/CDA1 family)
LPAQAYVTVLLYHRFDEDRFPTTTTGSAQFESHLAYLRGHGYKVMDLDGLARCIEGTAPFPGRAVVITVDDGFISEYNSAVPILRRYGFPFAVFVFTNGIGARGYMSWGQLKSLASSGGVVGCHTRSHPRLINMTPDAVDREILGSKKVLEAGLGRAVHYFAYPFGQYDEKVRRCAARAGFRLMFTSDPGSVGPGVERDLVPRQAVVGAEMTLEDFARKLENPPLRVSGRCPPPGVLSGRTLQGVDLTLEEPDLYDAGQINVFLSEKGRIPARLDPATGRLSCGGPFHLTRKTNRIIVSARRKSDGLFAMHSYMIVTPGVFEDMRYTLFGRQGVLEGGHDMDPGVVWARQGLFLQNREGDRL